MCGYDVPSNGNIRTTPLPDGESSRKASLCAVPSPVVRLLPGMYAGLGIVPGKCPKAAQMYIHQASQTYWFQIHGTDTPKLA